MGVGRYGCRFGLKVEGVGGGDSDLEISDDLPSRPNALVEGLGFGVQALGLRV